MFPDDLPDDVPEFLPETLPEMMDKFYKGFLAAINAINSESALRNQKAREIIEEIPGMEQIR